MFLYSKKDKNKLIGKKTDKMSVCTIDHQPEIFLTSCKNTDVRNEVLRSKDLNYKPKNMKKIQGRARTITEVGYATK